MKTWIIGVIGLAGLAAIVGASYISAAALLAVAVIAAAAVGVGWPHFLGIPAKKTLAVLIGLPGAGAAVAATYLPGPGFLDWTPSFMAAGVMAVFVMQLIRGTGQAQRLESTLGSSAGVLLSCLGAGWIACSRFNGVREMLLVAAISAAIALLAGLIRWPDRVVAPLGIVGAGLAGPLAGLVFSDIAVLPAAVVGVVVGAVLMSFRRLVILRGESLSFAAALGMGLGPVSAVGSLAYFIDKLLIY
ncbi:permease [Arthrobacter sp. AL08]|uniref:permease n=1 Tax=Micrococcaceae TaxID=1268 RepID=UPI00249B5E07|nr:MULTISPECIES: permease [Micrococcaceae]MDI3241497.1 permease [Arthrobacter sp. AL05]MDI3277246.1 permease [Arthrobacter sp. AL08]MDJ0352758.1 permease [Pseudarthrobacter sp. PH31-O2]